MSHIFGSYQPPKSRSGKLINLQQQFELVNFSSPLGITFELSRLIHTFNCDSIVVRDKHNDLVSRQHYCIRRYNNFV